MHPASGLASTIRVDTQINRIDVRIGRFFECLFAILRVKVTYIQVCDKEVWKVRSLFEIFSFLFALTVYTCPTADHSY